MKKQSLRFLTLTLIGILIYSCQDELELNNIENSQPVAVIEKTVENGRFVFSSKESLKQP